MTKPTLFLKQFEAAFNRMILEILKYDQHTVQKQRQRTR